ncbi:MAG: hypothetical protein QMC36_01570 [Patescibacteria group bacterium]
MHGEKVSLNSSSFSLWDETVFGMRKEMLANWKSEAKPMTTKMINLRLKKSFQVKSFHIKERLEARQEVIRDALFFGLFYDSFYREKTIVALNDQA